MQYRSLMSLAVSSLSAVVVLGGCGGSSESSVRQGTPAAGTAAVVRPAGTGTATTTTTEAELVKAVRPRAAALVEAIKGGNLTTARTAYTAYDAGWNGVEVYVNVRSRQLYADLETDLQTKLEEGLDAPQPNFPELTRTAEALLRKYDEAIALVTAGPPLHPLFDDVAAVRIVRADLRQTGPALKAGDLATARRTFQDFRRGWPGVEGLLKERSADAHSQITTALGQADSTFAAPTATPATLTVPVERLLDRYNYGLRLLNAAARGAVVAKTTYTPEDVSAAALLATLDQVLSDSLVAWESGDYAQAGTAARRATSDLFARVAAPLAAKSADADLKKALDTYTALAGGAGDRAKVQAAARAAREAAAVAQQSLAGQFWTAPAFQAEVAAQRKG